LTRRERLAAVHEEQARLAEHEARLPLPPGPEPAPGEPMSAGEPA
jgi:hypothetical protein